MNIFNKTFFSTKILRIKLRSIDESITYKPGDHLEIHPANPKEYVDYILERLKISHEEIKFDEPILFEVFDHKLSHGIT